MHVKSVSNNDFFRPTWVDISLSALKHNFRIIRKYISKKTGLLTVVKANGYGHGALEVAGVSLSSGSDYLGVSSIEEGIFLRKNGIKAPILILGSQYPFSAYTAVVKYNLIPTVASLASAHMLSKTGRKLKKLIPFHFKIDTGMGRIGVTPMSACEILTNIVRYSYIKLQGIYTHLASADVNKRFTLHQLKLFDDVRAYLKNSPIDVKLYHAANSAAAAYLPSSHYDMVRVGLSVYGLYPLKVKRYFKNLKPVLSWKSKIVFLKWLSKGATVSYGGTYRTVRSTKVATLPVGYADGYSRLLSNNGQVLIRGKICPVIGRVTMDMIMVDVTRVHDAAIGDTAVLIGRQGNERITVEDIAERTGTISYEVVCGINSRVPRIYT